MKVYPNSLFLISFRTASPKKNSQRPPLRVFFILSHLQYPKKADLTH